MIVYDCNKAVGAEGASDHCVCVLCMFCMVSI
jgi:hypothetical protein